MNMNRSPSRHNLSISYAVAILAMIAAWTGILGNVYLEDDWFRSQMIGQDVFTLAVALGLLILPLLGNEKAKLVQGGFFAYMVYTYVFYAFSVQFNVLFLVYIALCSFSMLGLFMVFRQLSVISLMDMKGWALKGSGIYLIVVCSILAFLWLGDIIGRMSGSPLLETPNGEPLTPVYILDLGFVIPACLYGAIQSLRRKFWGILLTGVMLIMVASMGFALMAMAIGLYAYGFGLEHFLTIFWCVLGTSGVVLSLFYLREIKFNQD
jgi:hypothetical protein